MLQPKNRILRCKDVIAILGIGKSTLYDWINHNSKRYDPTFPKSFKIGSASVGWDENEINTWIDKRKESRC